MDCEKEKERERRAGRRMGVCVCVCVWVCGGVDELSRAVEQAGRR